MIVPVFARNGRRRCEFMTVPRCINMVKATIEEIRASIRTAWCKASECLSVPVFAQNGLYKQSLAVTLVIGRKRRKRMRYMPVPMFVRNGLRLCKFMRCLSVLV